jgi:CO/xanthine dehydrogenase FAD-binding subunit
MRADPHQYQLAAPANLHEALALLNREPGQWMPIAGGTDIMVVYSAGKLPPRRMVNIAGFDELRAIEVTPQEVRIGSGTTYTTVRQHPVLSTEFPLLARSASLTGGIANQNRGTLGGNIANASPAGDSLPALLVYDADLILISTRGERRIPYRTFHTGYKKMQLAPDELIGSIVLQRPSPGLFHYSRKVGARNAQAISKVFLAAVGELSNDQKITIIRIAAGSVGPTPVRLLKTEQTLQNQTLTPDRIKHAGEVLASEIQPIDDIRSTAQYRIAVLRNLCAEFLSDLSKWRGPR